MTGLTLIEQIICPAIQDFGIEQKVGRLFVAIDSYFRG